MEFVSCSNKYVMARWRNYWHNERRGGKNMKTWHTISNQVFKKIILSTCQHFINNLIALRYISCKSVWFSSIMPYSDTLITGQEELRASDMGLVYLRDSFWLFSGCTLFCMAKERVLNLMNTHLCYRYIGGTLLPKMGLSLAPWPMPASLLVLWFFLN